MKKLFGWTGQIARVDLTTRTIEYIPTAKYAKRFIGGRGLASRVVAAAMDHAEARGLKVVPSCWYVAGWMARHPEYETLLR